MRRNFIAYLRDSATRLRAIAQNRPDIAAKLDSLADSFEAKASELEDNLGSAPPVC
jgi:hypothetical protein